MNRRSNQAFAGATLLLDGGFRQQLQLTWRLFRDDRVSMLKYGLPALVALYVASPIDPIPDFLLGVGQMDDLGVVVAAMLLLVRIIPMLAPADVVSDHLRQMGRQGPAAPEPGRDAENVVDAAYRVRYGGRQANGS